MLKNFIIRALSGLTYAALMLSAFAYYGKVWSFIVFALILILALREFYELTSENKRLELPHYVAMVLGAVFFCLLANEGVELGFIVSAVLTFTTVSVMELFRKKNNPINNIGLTVMGYVYVLLPVFCFMNFTSAYLLLFFFLMIWGSDTGAYLVGMCIGKHKMFERISPKKTWEGFFGGLAFALAVGYIAYLLQGNEWMRNTFGGFCYSESVTVNCYERFESFTLCQWLTLSAVVFCLGTLGDLVESLFKRHLGVKDSGNIMPGHGGMLDRFDSAFFAAPVALIIAKIFFLSNNC